ncbi:nidogen-1 isoform X2 [Ixodes scapularis]
MASCARPQLVLLLALLLHGARSLPTSDLFPFGITQDQSLTKENDVSSAEVQLSHPITFYGTEYSTLYVNDNGLVSFLTDVPSFFSAEFPLQYPLIAPLYCDVDTRGTGRVFYRETQEESLLLRFTALVSSQYAAASFRARSLFVATWDAVGYYERKIDKVNTFQLVIGFDERDAYALLLYPEGGIQWIQADGKVPSLPDAKAQAGFMSGDKTRYTLLRGSGTDHVVNLDKMGNTGVPGQWLFRISGQDGAEPDSAGRSGSDGGGGTCASVRVPCPPSSVCVDYEAGFCCRCDRGSFGNGKNCIKDGAPQRVNGKLTGVVNELPIGAEVDFHSYVVTGDGRSYTALSRVAPVSLASDLRALLTLADVVGWLFALPQGTDAVNGFTLTGGEFNRTAEVRFKQTGHQVTIHEHYLGVDVFNMMKVNVEVRGSLPTISQGSKVTVDDYSQDFDHVSPGVVKAHLSNQFSLEGSSLPVEYTVDQTIVFSDCPHAPVGKKGLQRVQVGRNFIDLDTKDGIVRYAQTTKVSPVDGGTYFSRCLVSGVTTNPEPCGFEYADTHEEPCGFAHPCLARGSVRSGVQRGTCTVQDISGNPGALWEPWETTPVLYAKVEALSPWAFPLGCKGSRGTQLFQRLGCRQCNGGDSIAHTSLVVLGRDRASPSLLVLEEDFLAQEAFSIGGNHTS